MNSFVLKGNICYSADEKNIISLPKSNVLYYELENNSWCCVRPSGTEPKIKFYWGVKTKSLIDSTKESQEIKEAIEKIIALYK